MTDPIVKELWTIKDELADECARDLRRLFEKLKTTQKSPDGKTVNRTGRRPQQASG